MRRLRNNGVVALLSQIERRACIVDDHADPPVGQRHVLAQPAGCLIGVDHSGLDLDDINVFDVIGHVFEDDTAAVANYQEIFDIGARQNGQRQQPLLTAHVRG